MEERAAWQEQIKKDLDRLEKNTAELQEQMDYAAALMAAAQAKVAALPVVPMEDDSDDSSDEEEEAPTVDHFQRSCLGG